jgi:hypothetical protein
MVPEELRSYSVHSAILYTENMFITYFYKNYDGKR